MEKLMDVLNNAVIAADIALIGVIFSMELLDLLRRKN